MLGRFCQLRKFLSFLNNQIIIRYLKELEIYKISDFFMQYPEAYLGYILQEWENIILREYTL